MTLDAVRAAAIDRALVGDDPGPALVLAGAVDGVVRATDDSVGGVDRPDVGDTDTGASAAADPFTTAMLAVGCIGAAGAVADRTLDDRAWRPGRDANPFVVAGAATAVRERGIAVERAAALAGCAPATLEAVVERQRREKET